MSDIFSASDLASYMNKTLINAVAAQVTAAVNQWVETRTKRCWGDTATATERYDWKRQLWLRHQDVTEVTSVKLGWPQQDQTTVDPGSYYFNEFGRLTLFASIIGPIGGSGVGAVNPTSQLLNDYIEVAYTYGVEDVPDDLTLAALGIAAGFYNWATNGNQNVVAASVGSYRLEYSGAVRGVGGPNSGQPATNVADANWEVIESYKTRRA